jgi:acetate---CoA ligase (ADP-forming)
VSGGPVRDLSPLFSPRSVAVLGASNDEGKWGNWLGRGALRGASRRPVFLVNRRGGEILGREAFRSLADLPAPPELVVVALPSAALPDAFEDAVAAGARAVVAISGGEEEGDAGGPRDRALAERARATGVLLLGPNCLGVFDEGEGLELVPNPFPAGTMGLLSQSGNLALELATLAPRAGLGFSRFVSLGNQADLGPAELMLDLARHEPTRLIALYCEDFGDGRALADAARTAVEARKPVLLLTVSGREATARAVRSHTGALASDARAIDAACRAGGIERVRSPRELVDVALALSAGTPPRGRRVGIVADGGGHGAVAAELALDAGLSVPGLSAATTGRLRELLPRRAGSGNPIDLAGGGERDVWTFSRTADALFESGDVDAVLVTGYFGGYGAYSADLGDDEVDVARALARSAAEPGRTLVVHTMYPDTPAARELAAGGVPLYDAVERAVVALARATGRRPPAGVPPLPPPEAPLVSADYAAARRVLEGAGLAFAQARTVSTLGEAREAAANLGFPVVLKGLGALHKSEAGAVEAGIADERDLDRAFGDLEARLSPPAWSVEEMADTARGVELLLGVRWDARFGPIAVVGLGGVHAEVLDDVAVALAPVDEPEAEGLILSLRGAPMLLGARGRPALDVTAAARALARLSAFGAAHPEVSELEVNPLLVLPRGAIGLDARMVLAEVATGRPFEGSSLEEVRR